MCFVDGLVTYCSYITGIRTSAPPNTVLPKRYMFSNKLNEVLYFQSCFLAVSERNPAITKREKNKTSDFHEKRFPDFGRVTDCCFSVIYPKKEEMIKMRGKNHGE